jgi:hypothetical protein
VEAHHQTLQWGENDSMDLRYFDYCVGVLLVSAEQSSRDSGSPNSPMSGMLGAWRNGYSRFVELSFCACTNCENLMDPGHRVSTGGQPQ